VSEAAFSSIMPCQTDFLSSLSPGWAILSTRTERLDFLYVDPTFSQHLTLEADRIKGTSFFDYIHTEEEERTRVDMKNIIQSRTLFGSVTRCRYSSLSHIQSILRADASLKAAEAKDYLPIDIVVNWIGEDMALCFFHAILDESAQDNNELDKTDWSNWCGMQDASVGDEECQSMWQSIQSHRTLKPSTTGPQYVFQVLSAVPSSQQESASLPNVLFSWPPPRLFADPTGDALTASAINFADGSYFLDDFARLAQGVDQLTLQKELSDANTSCTRRFRAKHTLTTEGMIRSVESVLIPYGSIVLACFSITYAQVLPGSSAPLSVNRRASVEVPLATFDNKSSVTAKEDASLHYNNKNGSAVPLSSSTLASLANASISAAAAAKGGEKPEKNGLQGLLSRAEGEGSDVGGGSVATLAAVAAAASAQSKKCASCGASNSPEWRKGPDGTKSLCNACGLRFSRNISRVRKREERALLAAEVAANGGIVPPHIRKKLGEEKKKVKRPKVSKKEEEDDSIGVSVTAPAVDSNRGIDKEEEQV
jgi:hypothetical protein